MRIIVCVKEISLIYARTGDNPATHFISEDDRVDLTNPYDRVSVEESLRIKERFGGEVILVTLGPLNRKEHLKKCWAMGADEVLEVRPPPSRVLDHRAKAIVLASVIQKLNADLVFCGKKSLDTEGGQFGAWLAERLSFVYVSGVIGVEFEQEPKHMTIHRALERGDRQAIHCELPAVLSVEMGLNQPRYPKLSQTLWALKQTIRQLDASDLGFTQDRAKILKTVESSIQISLPRPRPRRVFTPDARNSAMDRIRQVMSGGIQEKGGKIHRGSPDLLGQKVVDFLATNGFIRAKPKHKKSTRS